MVAVSTAFALLLVLSANGAQADVCTKPTGGIIDLPYSACLADKVNCFDWMNAKCVGKFKCECKDDQCVMGSQCVDVGGCTTLTGGLCAIFGCDRWRSATCSKGSHEHVCICGPGTCPVGGECRPPGVCAKATGGSCNHLSCHGWRKSTCSVSGIAGLTEQAKCMCGDGDCPINGECVPVGGCPRYTGASCTVFRATGFLPCGVGSCNEDSYCFCKPDECFVDGKCVPANAEAIQLSRAWGEAQGAKAFGTGGTSAAAGALACGAAASVGLGAAVMRSVRARASRQASDYMSLEG